MGLKGCWIVVFILLSIGLESKSSESKGWKSESEKLKREGYDCIYEIGYKAVPDRKAAFEEIKRALMAQEKFSWRTEGDVTYVTVGKKVTNPSSCNIFARNHAKFSRLSRNDLSVENQGQKALADYKEKKFLYEQSKENYETGKSKIPPGKEPTRPNINLGVNVSVKAQFKNKEVVDLCDISLCAENTQPAKPEVMSPQPAAQ